MQAEHLATKDERKFEPRADAPLWMPTVVHGPDADDRRAVDVRADDRYFAVDDVADGMVVAEVSSWPRLDREGRLWWGDEPYEFATPLERMQRDVNAARRRNGVMAATRRIRVGDTFLVRGLTRSHRYLTKVPLIVDISAAAREAAKAALHGAVASTLAEGQAAELHVDDAYVTPRPEDGLFDVRQSRPPSEDEATR
ncbi:hypothetical protein BH23ACT10_BH23ACT10_27880 [soil metagenome]